MTKIFSTIGAEKKNLDMKKLIAECVHGLLVIETAILTIYSYILTLFLNSYLHANKYIFQLSLEQLLKKGIFTNKISPAN